MNDESAKNRKKAAAYRERVRAADRTIFNVNMPSDLVARVDQMKDGKGVRSRSPIIEEAVRFYIEKHEG